MVALIFWGIVVTNYGVSKRNYKATDGGTNDPEHGTTNECADCATTSGSSHTKTHCRFFDLDFNRLEGPLMMCI